MSNIATIEQQAIQTETAAIIGMIERAATNPNVDVEKFARLLEMRERVEGQFARKAFSAAISRAKGEIGPILKDKTVDFSTSKGRTNYRFEGFDTVARTVDPVLNRYGLSYRFRAEQGGGKLRVTCVLSHADGYSEETTLEASEDHSGNKNSIQAVGSAATYLQRYTLKLALGLATSLDDDAQAVGRAYEPQPAFEENAPVEPTINDNQRKTIERKIAETESDTLAFCKWMKVARLADIPASEYENAIKKLNEKAERIAAQKVETNA